MIQISSSESPGTIEETDTIDAKVDVEAFKRFLETAEGVGLVEKVAEFDSEPFTVAVMGQTGTGKSSLINALFGTDLATDPVRPCTKEVTSVVATTDSGKVLRFLDLPGLGESSEADDRYLASYRDAWVNADAVLWTIMADNRSAEFDLHCLQALLQSDSTDEQGLINKVTFVMTKSDLISPDPWLLDQFNPILMPQARTRVVLDDKSRYWRDIVLRPYADILVSETTVDDDFPALQNQRLAAEDGVVRHHGLVDESSATELAISYPGIPEVIDRLYSNHQVIATSAKFRFNLERIMSVIVDKMEEEGAMRLRLHAAKVRNVLDIVDFEVAKTYRNIVARGADGRIFDLAREV